MKKYIFSALLILSYPQMSLAEQNLETQQINQQLHYVNDWLSSREFSHKMQQMMDEYQKKIETHFAHDLDEKIEIEGQKQNKKLMKIVENLQPQSQELSEIQRIWLNVLHSAINNTDEESNPEHDDIDTKMEKIDALNSTLETKAFNFIQQQHSPEYVTDWIRYKQLKNDMKKKRNTLEQSLNSVLTQTAEQNKIKLQQELIQKITQTELNMLRGFKTNSSELKNIVAMQIQAIKAAEKMSLNAVLNTRTNADEMNNISELFNQIKKLEHRFEFKTVLYLRSIRS